MEKTSKKVFGIVAISFVAIVCALMFSLFANAETKDALSQPAEVQEAAAVNAETANITITAYKDDLGNPDSLFTTDATQTIDKWVSEMTLSDVPVGSDYEYTGSTSEDTDTVLTITNANPAYNKKITFRSADKKMYSNMVKAYNVTSQTALSQNSTGKIEGDGEIASIAENLLCYEAHFLCRSPKEFANFTNRIAKFQENENGTWVDLICYGHVFTFRPGKDPRTTNEFCINSSNQTVSWKEYTVDPQKPWTKTTTIRTVRLAMLASGFDLTDFKAHDINDNSKLVDKLTTDGCFFTANIGLSDYCVDGIKYNIITLDGVKEHIYRNIDEIIQELIDSGIGGEYVAKFAGFIREMGAGIFALPSTITCVSGLEDGYEPENLDIPAVITVPGKGSFTVNGIMPGALSGDKIKTVNIPFTMQVVFENAATGLENLEKINCETGSLVYLPDFHADYTPSSEKKWEDRGYCNIEKLFYFLKGYKHVAKKISEGQEEGLAKDKIIANINKSLRNTMPSAYNTLGKYENLAEECVKILGERAFPYQMLASLQTGSTAEGVDLSLIVANDNSLAKPFFAYIDAINALYPHDPLDPQNTLDFSDLDTKTNKTSYISLKGTYEKVDNFKIKGSDKEYMLGTATFTSAVVDADTHTPISGAVVKLTDELGVEHVATTDYKGAFTIDGLYQTGAIYNTPAIHLTSLKFRTVSIIADGYEEVNIDEKDIHTEELEWACFPFKQYTYTNAQGNQTSDVVWEQPAKLHSIYGPSRTGYLSCATNMNYVVDVAAGSKVSGANVQCYEFNETAAQQFRVEKLDETRDGKELCVIVNINSNNVLDVNGGVAANYNNVQQYKWNDTDAQKWTIEYDGSFVVFHSAINDEYVLDLNAGNAQNGQNIQIFQANGSNAQKFHMIDKNPSVPGGNFDLVDGIYEIHAAVNNDNVLDVQWGSHDDCADVWSYKYAEGNTNQQWKVTNLGYGYYSIVNVNTGKALDVAGCGIIPGTNVWQYSYSPDNKAQVWSIFKCSDGSYSLINAGTGLTLDIAGGSTDSEANVQGYFYNGTAAQSWKFVQVK